MACGVSASFKGSANQRGHQHRQRRAAADEAIKPLDLALQGACRLAAAVAKKEDAAPALATLPPSLHAAFASPDGAPSAAFVKSYETLEATEPMG